MRKGLFITFEGGDGSGKTTASKYICQKLQEAGYEVVYTREPGGSNIAEQIRSVILDVNNTLMDNRTEALLYAASRRQHLVEVILPALAAHKIVICDRFVDSSLAYQGFARGIGIDAVMEINRFAIENCMPDLTLFFDIDPAIGLQRIHSRDYLDRLENESLNFHYQVHEGYKLVCERCPNRIKVIDGTMSIPEVQQKSLQLVMQLVEENV